MDSSLVNNVAGLLVDKCLQFPISSALVFSLGFYLFWPVYADPNHNNRIEGKRWIISCLITFILVGLALTSFIPTLQLTPNRIIFRPTPSCSTYNNPPRYLAFILDVNNNQAFYVTTVKGVNNTDPRMKDAAPFYVISSWIRSPNHYRTTKRILFEPAKGKPYNLPYGYCVRAAGPTSADPLLVAFYSLNGTETILQDTGYISKEFLEEYHFGWYLVSNCRTDVSRWFLDCKTGYVSSTYVRLPEYVRILLLENSESMKEPSASELSQKVDSSAPSSAGDTQQAKKHTEKATVDDGDVAMSVDTSKNTAGRKSEL